MNKLVSLVVLLFLSGCASKPLPMLSPKDFWFEPKLVSGQADHKKVGDWVIVKQYHPVYPYYANKYKREGWVTLKYTVNENGEPANISVVDSSPVGQFEEQAIRALKLFRYKYTGLDEPVASSETEIRFPFTLCGLKC